MKARSCILLTPLCHFCARMFLARAHVQDRSLTQDE
jgi:hypothetical protein